MINIRPIYLFFVFPEPPDEQSDPVRSRYREVYGRYAVLRPRGRSNSTELVDEVRLPSPQRGRLRAARTYICLRRVPIESCLRTVQVVQVRCSPVGRKCIAAIRVSKKETS